MIRILLEAGSKRTFATAIDWPGWARSGRDGNSAIAALVEYGPRYKTAIGARLALPRDERDVDIVERAKGDSGTEFGVPSSNPAIDREPIEARDLKRLVAILEACWDTFDAAAKRAKGKTLTTGPRGGGRALAKIVDHHREAEGAYLRQLGGTVPPAAPIEAIRAAFVDALDARRRGELPDRGPRGGRRWTPREAVRRSAWHALDHAWEIEDRAGLV